MASGTCTSRPTAPGDKAPGSRCAPWRRRSEARDRPLARLALVLVALDLDEHPPLLIRQCEGEVEPDRRLLDDLARVVRGLLGERLRELRCLTGAPACEGCPEAAQCDHHRLFDRAHDAQETRAFWLQGVTHDAAVPDAPFEASLCTWSVDDPALPYLDVALRDALARRRQASPPNLLGPTRADSPPWAPPAPARVTIVARSPLSLRGNLEAATALCPGVPELGLLLRAGVRRLDALLRVSGASALALEDAPPSA